MYLLSLAVLATVVLNAQHVTTRENYMLSQPLNETSQNTNRPTQSQNRAGGDIIVTNDFSNPTDWTTPSDAGGYSWTVGTTTPVNINQYMGAMESSTMTNGFASFAGIDLLLAVPFAAQHTYLELNQTIDCSSNPGVILEFEQRYRAFNSDETIVQVSNNNGTTWTDFIVNDLVATNATAIQNTIALNISSIAGNNSNVKVRFLWTGTDDQIFGAGYGWMIDDLKIFEAHDFNLVQQNLYLGDIVTNYEYTKLPISQAGILTVQSALYNGGISTPATVQSHVLVTDQSNAVILNTVGGTLSAGTLAPGNQSTLTFETTLDMSTLPIGTYMVENTIELNVPDGDPSDNIDTSYFEITDNLYSHYADYKTEYLINPGKNNTATYNESTFGAMFAINNNDTLQGINLYIADVTPLSTDLNTTTNNIITVKIYQNTTDFFAPIQLAQYTFDMATLNVNDWNTLNLYYPDPATTVNTGYLPLVANETYRVTVTSEEGDVLWTFGNQPDSDFSGIQQTSNGWFSLQSEPALELNFDNTLVPPILPDLTPLTDTIALCVLDSVIAPTANSGTLIGTTTTVFPIVSNSTIIWTFNDTIGNTFTQTQNVIINQVDNTVNQFGAVLVANSSGNTYQWINCNNINQVITGETNQSFTALANGNYAVIINNGVCTDTSNCYSVVGLSIDKNNFEINLIAYPNPTSGKFIIDLRDTYTTIDVKITNLLGENINTYNFKNQNTVTLNINESEGVYFIRIQTEEGNETILKVIKK